MVKTEPMKKAFINATIYNGENRIDGYTVLTDNDRIDSVAVSGTLPEDVEKIDCTGLVMAPGLIDLQIYGGGGFLFSNKPTAEALHAMTEALLRTGTTGFCPTLATNSMEVFYEAIKVVRENPHPAVLGLHLEGPYINPSKKGAHIEAHIRRPEIKEVEELLRQANGAIRIMTLAPEQCDPAVIRLLKDNGVVVSAGHSNATYQEAVEGYKHGITTNTHLFNAMSSIHHRETGLPGAVYLSEGVYASIIADGIHVDYNTLKISKRMLKERLFLITDAVEENKEGAYVHVRRKDRFTLPDGTLSGSLLTLLGAVRNCVEKADIPLDEAIRMASTYPSRVLNLTDRGSIAAGLKANFTLFSADYQPAMTVLEGQIIQP